VNAELDYLYNNHFFIHTWYGSRGKSVLR